ncbi:MAG: hypothetical protein IPO93_03565 [Actinobacteria bacterium]|jgi:hypothetical protein|nr:hypothetical protein [Actinomycetota bacterium]
MADDEIERLLREIDATNRPAAPTPGSAVEKPKNTPATTDDKSGGRFAFAVIAAVAMGVVTFGLGAFLWFLPLVDPNPLSMGFGGALAGFVTAFITGPPRWFSS